MTLARIDEILATESACVARAATGKCNRDCKNCDLVLPTREILLAYSLLRYFIALMNEDINTSVFDETFDEYGIDR